jgi:hypothetical protein
LGQVWVLHVPSSHQFADIMTKGLPVQLFTDLCPVFVFVTLLLRLREGVRIYCNSPYWDYGPLALYTVTLAY